MRWGIIAAVGVLILGLAGVGVGLALSGDDADPAGAMATAQNPPAGSAGGGEDKSPTGAGGGTATGEAKKDGDEAKKDGDEVKKDGDEADDGKVDDGAVASREITIDSDPPGASVLRDGESLGQTPLTLKLAPDEKPALELALEGYQKETLDVAPGGDPILKVSLKGIALNNPRPHANNDNKGKNTVKPNQGVGKDPKGKDPKGGKGDGKGGSGNDYEVF